LGPILFVFILSLFANVLACMVVLSIDWARYDVLAFFFVHLVLVLLASWVLLFWDLASSSLSSWIATFDVDDFYSHPRSGTVYDNWVGVVDVFD